MFAYFNDIITDLRWRGINYVGDTVIEPSSRWRFGGKRKLRQRGKKDCTRGWNVPLWGRGGWEKEQRAALAALHRSIRLYHPGAPTPSVDTGFRCFRAQESIIARWNYARHDDSLDSAFLHANYIVAVVWTESKNCDLFEDFLRFCTWKSVWKFCLKRFKSLLLRFFVNNKSSEISENTFVYF